MDMKATYPPGPYPRITAAPAGIAFILFLACVLAAADDPVKGPCVAFPRGATSGEVTIWWEAASAGEGWVRYGISGSGQRESVADTARNARHEVLLSGLQAGKTYEYEIGGSGVSGGGRFKIPARGVRKFRFAALGDPRAYDAAARDMLPLLMADAPDFVIAVGDYVHRGKDPAGRYDNWNQCFAFFRPLLRNVPFFPAIGDHEYGNDATGEAFRQHFVLPNNELWYSFDWGNCHFIALDVTWDQSMREGTPQRQWIERDLATVAGRRDLIVAYFHLPGDSVGHCTDRDTKERTQRLLPLFKQHGVRLLFCGHDHNYQRWLMDGMITHVVCGGFTVERLYKIEGDVESGKARGLKMAESVPHYILVEVDGSRVKGLVKGRKDELIDTFSLSGR